MATPLRRARGQLAWRTGRSATTTSRPTTTGSSGRSASPATLRRAADRPLRAVARLPDAAAARRPRSGSRSAPRPTASAGAGDRCRSRSTACRATGARRACTARSASATRAPVDAKNGTHNTVDPARAGDRQLRPAGARAGREIARDGRGVRMIVGGAERTVRCDRVVVCAGAVETPRLLLASGLGNAVVGTNLHNHSFAMLYGTATSRSSASRVPATPWHAGLRAPRRRGLGRRRALRRAVAAAGGRRGDRRPPRISDLGRRPQDLDARRPAPHRGWHGDRPGDPVGALAGHARPDVRDVHGMPVARLHGAVHPATAEVREYMRGHLDTLAGRDRHRRRDGLRLRPPPAAAGEHSAGTCRMGEDPATSACDRDGRLHGAENVYVADASLLNTNGGVEPVRHDDGERVAGGRRARPAIARANRDVEARACVTLTVRCGRTRSNQPPVNAPARPVRT